MGDFNSRYDPHTLRFVQLLRHVHNSGNDPIEIRGITMIRDSQCRVTQGLNPPHQFRGEEFAVTKQGMGV